MLHPQKYARHVLEDLMAFYKGHIGYPEIDLKLAGDEAWSDAFPELRDAIHRIVETIHEYAEMYGWDYRQPTKRELDELFSELRPLIKTVMEFAEGNAPEELEYYQEISSY